MRHKRALIAAAAALGTMALAGCGSMLGGSGARPADAAPSVDRTTASAVLLTGYLETVQRLIQGAPAEQAEILASTKREFDVAPTPSHELRYALVLAAPGHAGTDPAHAQQLLRELLAAPETLLPTERALAFVQLKTMDRQLTLVAENQRLQSDAERADRDRSAATTRRLQAEIDENARLKKELDQAQAKLAEIADIESRLNKRKRPPEGSTP